MNPSEPAALNPPNAVDLMSRLARSVVKISEGTNITAEATPKANITAGKAACDQRPRLMTPMP